MPYSTKEVYGIRTSGKYHFPEQVYHEFYPIIDETAQQFCSENQRDYVLLIEDEKSGYQFYSSITGACVGVGGNAKFFSRIQKAGKEKDIYVIADGAAFGAYISDNLELKKRGYSVSMYLPESFEWLILKSGVLDRGQAEEVLENPEDYIESREFFSWERFFTDYLRKNTEGDKARRYSKDHLAEYYKSKPVRDKVISVLPIEFQKILTSADK